MINKAILFFLLLIDIVHNYKNKLTEKIKKNFVFPKLLLKGNQYFEFTITSFLTT